MSCGCDRSRWWAAASAARNDPAGSVPATDPAEKCASVARDSIVSSINGELDQDEPAKLASAAGSCPAPRERPINFRQLKYFVKVVETGNMTRAASELNVSQPALGLQIRQLEEQYRVELFQRHSRGAIPTAAGLFLYSRSKEILSAVEETECALYNFDQGAKERLTIGLTPSIARQLGASLLLDAQMSMPNMFFRFIEGFDVTLRDATRRGEIDIGFMYDVHDAPAGLEATAMLREDFVFLIRDDGSRLDGADMPLRDVLNYKLVFQKNHKAVQRALQEVADEHSTAPDIAFEMQSAEAIGDIIERGYAAAILPYGFMVNAVKSGRVRAVRITDPTISRTLYVVRPQEKPIARAGGEILSFVAMVRERLIRSLGEFCHPLSELDGDAFGRAASVLV
jgi:LysR family nitrogen assimilation transcriptional regulator